MDGTKRKKKPFEFAEGHKRETRKSYQSFIESSGKLESITNISLNESHPISQVQLPSLDEFEEMAEEGVRKSSRKPVPKKSFDLVDVFEEHSPLMKHSANQRKPTSTNVNQMEEINIKQEPLDEGFDSAPRKSSRVPVPKRSFDLIDSKFAGPVTTNMLQPIRAEVVEDKNQSKITKSKKQRLSVGMNKTKEVLPSKKNKKPAQEKEGESSNTVIESMSSDNTLPRAEVDTLPSEAKDAEHDNRETPKFTLKLDFKSKKILKKEKGNRKRKANESPAVESLIKYQSCASNIKEEPTEKVPKAVVDNIDQSALMEALQALKQEPQDEKEKTLSQPEEKGRKSRSKKTPSKIKKEPVTGCKVPEQSLEAEKEEKVSDSEPAQEKTDQSDATWDYPSSTTEISDGHVILKLGGLHSPTKKNPSKVKKHKKKHKHGHHSHLTEFTNAKEGNLDHKAKLNDDNDTLDKHSSYQVVNAISMETEATTSEISTANESKDKRDKSHKKKRKPPQDKSQDASEKCEQEIAPKEDDLIVKKRKIYKKKKGEKILVRIQTEFWNKKGELVKVQPKDIDGGNMHQTHHKRSVKEKKKKTVGNLLPLSERQSNEHMIEETVQQVDLNHSGMKQDARKVQEEKEKKQKKQVPSNIQQVKSTTLKKQTVQPRGSLNAKKLQSVGNKKKKKERKTQTLTAYLLYCRKYRPKVVSENPDIGWLCLIFRIHYIFISCLLSNLLAFI